METLVAKPAPGFKAQAVMPDGSFQELELRDFRGRYVVLFFYPMDFTFVCPTEIIAFSNRMQDFTDRDVQVLGVSVDSHYSHLAWRNTPRTEGGIGEVAYPLVSDLTRDISQKYRVLSDEGVAFRGLFLIDPEGIIRHQLVNDLPLGRSVDEVLRTIDAWKFYVEHGEVCPANWHQGEATIKPDPTGSKQFFSQEYASKT